MVQRGGPGQIQIHIQSLVQVQSFNEDAAETRCQSASWPSLTRDQFPLPAGSQSHPLFLFLRLPAAHQIALVPRGLISGLRLLLLSVRVASLDVSGGQ